MATRLEDARVPAPPSEARERVARWAPVVAWAALISLLSTRWFSGEHTGSFLLPILHALFPRASRETLVALHQAIRKLAHFTEYLVLTLLLHRALRRGPEWDVRVAGQALLIAGLYATLDELHQALAPGRTPSGVDCLVDLLGAVVGQAIVALHAHRREAAAATRSS